MLKLFKNLPIFRRLFLAFFLAVLIPDIIIVTMGSIDIQVLNASGLGAAQTGPLVLGTAIALLLSTGIVITLGYIVNVTITRPLRQLASLTKRIKQGETNARASISGRDEISLVAISMNSMLDNIVQLIQQTQQQRDHLQSQVEKLVSEVSIVGEGDLRIRAEVTTDTLGILAESFNYMVKELSSLVVRVKMVAREVGLSATGTYGQMAELVRSADIQIQQISMASERIEQMSQSSQRASQKVQILDEAADEARQSVHSGLSTVQRTMDRMTHINTNMQDTAMKAQVLEDRSREIDEIVNVISGIANNTNRLALDAAIQASMAGKNGKGFLAIADDIRRLSERAKEQAGLISRIVRNVREDIKAAIVSIQETVSETSEGAALAQDTGTVFERIYSLVEQQAREIDIINQEVRLLLQASTPVVHIMQSVSTSTQQSSVSTRKVAQHMEILARRAEQLLKSVEVFKFKEDAPIPLIAMQDSGQHSNHDQVIKQ